MSDTPGADATPGGQPMTVDDIRAAMSPQQIAEALAAPFPGAQVRWRVTAVTKDKARGLAVPYLDAAAIMDRLDLAVGPSNWADTYERWGEHGVMCGISIRVGDDWVTKHDGAGEPEYEETKGGFTNAFKRAAVKWGVGRYLRGVQGAWVPVEARGKSYVLHEVPSLPASALPAGERETPRPSTKANGNRARGDTRSRPTTPNGPAPTGATSPPARTDRRAAEDTLNAYIDSGEISAAWFAVKCKSLGVEPADLSSATDRQLSQLVDLAMDKVAADAGLGREPLT